MTDKRTPTMNKKWTEGDVVCDALGKMSFRAAAEWFNAKLPKQYQITHQTVANWAVDRTKANAETLGALLMCYPDGDPRGVMAKTLLEMRAAKMRKLMERSHWLNKATAA